MIEIFYRHVVRIINLLPIWDPHFVISNVIVNSFNVANVGPMVCFVDLVS